MTEKTETNQIDEQVLERRKNAMVFNQHLFAKLVINELKQSTSGRQVLKKYKQSEVREFIENYQIPKNQEKLREISRTLYVRSTQYQRLIQYFAKMALFPTIIKPIKALSKNEKKALKQYVDIAELLEVLNLKHEMTKVMLAGFTEDVFYGYIHRTEKNSFYIQPMISDMCKITHVEDGVYNYSIDMLAVQKNEKYIKSYPEEIQSKYEKWKSLKNDKTSKNKKTDDWNWVELDGKNTICIKVNEGTLDIFPMFAGCFDSIFDIDGFKQLRKDKEELDNYMLLAQELPIRKDTEDNNDFAIDEQWMNFFHNMASDAVPENVGVITSPMPITPIVFNKDKTVKDGVADAERDFWSATGTSQLIFNSDSSTSQGLLMSIKSDEDIVFSVLDQIQRWLNRYLKSLYSDLMFNVEILKITRFNQKEQLDMTVQLGTYGFPVKNRIASIGGISPLEMMEGLKLENEILKLDSKMIPLVSSHTQTGDNSQQSGRPSKSLDDKTLSDEANRTKDKTN